MHSGSEAPEQGVEKKPFEPVVSAADRLDWSKWRDLKCKGDKLHDDPFFWVVALFVLVPMAAVLGSLALLVAMLLWKVLGLFGCGVLGFFGYRWVRKQCVVHPADRQTQMLIPEIQKLERTLLAASGLKVTQSFWDECLGRYDAETRENVHARFNLLVADYRRLNAGAVPEETLTFLINWTRARVGSEEKPEKKKEEKPTHQNLFWIAVDFVADLWIVLKEFKTQVSERMETRSDPSQRVCVSLETKTEPQTFAIKDEKTDDEIWKDIVSKVELVLPLAENRRIWVPIIEVPWVRVSMFEQRIVSWCQNLGLEARLSRFGLHGAYLDIVNNSSGRPAWS